jgi:hypothetical protein
MPRPHRAFQDYRDVVAGSARVCLIDSSVSIRSPGGYVAHAVVAQLVEHELPKLGVEGSNPFRRSRSPRWGELPSHYFGVVRFQS